MTHLIVKTLLTSLVVVGVSELGKRVSFFAALLASLPLTSLLALVWLYWDTRDAQKVIELSYEILVLLPPSFVFFLSLPIFLRKSISFSMSLVFACVLTALSYFIYIRVLKQMGLA